MGENEEYAGGVHPLVREKMLKQKYHFVGSHSSVKPCKWLKESIVRNRTCYKHEFYGIRSWRCLQCSPSVNCTLSCRFCWRVQPIDFGLRIDETRAPKKWDEPAAIAEGLISEQKRIVSGYKGFSGSDLTRWEEAKDPAHATMSLTGEPTMYPYLSELMDEFHKRKMTTFLVSNATLPEKISALTTMSTQLYYSMQAPDRETYAKVCRPQLPDAWERFNESLELMRTLKKTRRTLRMTLVKGLNFSYPEGYAKLVAKAEPDYVEVKAFVFVGGSRADNRGLSLELMPKHDEIKEFAAKLAAETGYLPSAEHAPSRVMLLCKDEEAEKKRKLKFEK